MEAALEVMENSAGSADREMEIIQQSLTYKINALKETWVGFAQSTVSRDFLGGAIDGLTSLSEIVTTLVENFGLLQTVAGAALGIFAQKKGFGKRKCVSVVVYNALFYKAA